MSQCIAFEVVNNKTVRCVNIVANGHDWVCSLPKCQRMYSRMVESDSSVIIALHNIMNDDDDNVGSDTDESMCGNGMLPMRCESKRERASTRIGGPIIDATNGVASNTDPAGALKKDA
jgi:hypothetical protein